MRVVVLTLFSIAVSGGGVALGQGAPAAGDSGPVRSQERPEEIIVRGRRLAEFRVEVEPGTRARIRHLQRAMHDRMNDEIMRLARPDLRFGQAILDFFEASQQHEEARQRREE